MRTKLLRAAFDAYKAAQGNVKNICVHFSAKKVKKKSIDNNTYSPLEEWIIWSETYQHH
jgi:hypothetical protein